MIVILDYGVGNLGSIYRMLRKLGADVCVSRDSRDVKRATRLILPGVGAFDHGMASLAGSGLLESLEPRVRSAGVPLLGICLGLQMLGRGSAEGSAAGLGWLDLDTVRIRAEVPADELLVPHVGWTAVARRQPASLVDGLDGAEVYYSHSYVVRPDDEADVIATSTYGSEFACAVAHGNIAGVQFHPEKSHSAGRRLLANFARSA